MVVVYCDICGKRIDLNHDKRFKLTSFAVNGSLPLSEQNTLKTIYNCDDVCEECIDNLNEYIRENKQIIIFKDGTSDGMKYTE